MPKIVKRQESTPLIFPPRNAVHFDSSASSRVRRFDPLGFSLCVTTLFAQKFRGGVNAGLNYPVENASSLSHVVKKSFSQLL